MNTARVALAVALVSLIVAIVAILAIAVRPAADDPSPDGVAALESKLGAIEERLDTISTALDEATGRSKRTDDALAKLTEDVEELKRATERLAERPAAPPPPEIPAGVRFHDTFEEGTDSWVVLRFAPMVTGAVEHSTEEGHAKEGRGGLVFTYAQEQGKLPIAVRTAHGINRLSLWVRTLHRPAEVHVGANERDDSNYGTMIHIEPGDGWKRLELDLSTFVLDQHSHDENGRLDFDQIRGVAVADLAGFVGGAGENVLLIDEVVGEFRAAEAGPPPEKDQF